MKIKLVVAVAMCLGLTASGLICAENGIDDRGSGGKISLDIKGMDVNDVLKMLAARAGLNIVLGKNVTGRSTVFLKDVDVRDAFEIIILANELAYETQGGIINIMTQRDYETQHGERFQDKKQVKTIQLKYAKAADLSRALTQIKTTVGRVIADEGSNTLCLIDTPGKLGEMEAFINSTDLPVQTKVYNLNYAQADKLMPKIQEALTKGVGAIRMDERTNKIAVTDFPAKLEELNQIISAFDEKTMQVVIDAQIVEISPRKDYFSAGVDWDYWLRKNVRLTGALPAAGLTDAAIIPNVLSFGVAAADQEVGSVSQYKSIIDALRVIGETKILSSPRVMALNNQEAKIMVGTKDAYITSSTSQTGETAITSQSVNFVEVGIKLYVTPTINRDGFVTMKIKPEISSATRTSITSQGEVTQIPIVTTSEAETAVMVKDGSTIIIAGLKKDKYEREVKKFPVLGDIPLIGYAFRNTRDEKTKTELVIFLTPHIVSGEENIAYTSLTQDKDIEYIQAQTQAPESVQLGRSQQYSDYLAELFDKIKIASRVISQSSERAKGRIQMAFTLGSDGYLVDEPRVVKTSNEQINLMARESIKSAQPFAPFPPEIDKQKETFNVKLTFE